MRAVDWAQAETTVRRPGRAAAVMISVTFLIVGSGGLVWGESEFADDGAEIWIPRALFGGFTLLGGLAFLAALRAVTSSVAVRHADASVLPDVSPEPVISEGWIVHRRLTHELTDTSQAWQLTPRQSLWNSNKRFLIGFGIPFSVLCVGVLSWIVHSQEIFPGWALSVLVAGVVTAVCAGSALVLIGFLMRAGYRRLCRLSIPSDRGELELHAPAALDLECQNPAQALGRLLRGPTQFSCRHIPRERVIAVQLCAWYYEINSSSGKTSALAVQGLLVLSSEEPTGYVRVPLLLTTAAADAAQLMQQLGQLLGVPFLFHADAAAWRAERQRSKARPLLRSGGIMN